MGKRKWRASAGGEIASCTDLADLRRTADEVSVRKLAQASRMWRRASTKSVLPVRRLNALADGVAETHLDGLTREGAVLGARSRGTMSGRHGRFRFDPGNAAAARGMKTQSAPLALDRRRRDHPQCASVGSGWSWPRATVGRATIASSSSATPATSITACRDRPRDQRHEIEPQRCGRPSRIRNARQSATAPPRASN